MTRKLFIILALVLSFVAGHLLTRVSPTTSLAQEARKSPQSERVLVRGHARAITSLQSPTRHEVFTLMLEGVTNSSFTVVPKGKKFVLTDIMLHPQGSVSETITVNIGSGSEKGAGILTQMRTEPNGYEQASLCSGYVIPAGKSLVAFTGWGPKPEQYVSISVTGYLTDEEDKQE